MKIYFFCPRWGSEHMGWDSFCARVKADGYDGIEAVIPFDQAEKTEIAEALNKHDLLLIGQYYQSLEKDLQSHQESFIKHLQNLADLQPLLIDSQTGKDFYTPEQNATLFNLASAITARTGVIIAHETHRNKALFAAHVSHQLLMANPEVSITADFSHWCNVSESLLEQQQEAVDFAITRAIHIHARVGHSEAPQVTDPRAPEWKTELNAHLNWWDKIVQHRLSSGTAVLTITPEFGPWPYMPALPYTGMPVAGQWGINLFMKNLLKERYAPIEIGG